MPWKRRRCCFHGCCCCFRPTAWPPARRESWSPLRTCHSRTVCSSPLSLQGGGGYNNRGPAKGGDTPPLFKANTVDKESYNMSPPSVWISPILSLFDWSLSCFGVTNTKTNTLAFSVTARLLPLEANAVQLEQPVSRGHHIIKLNSSCCCKNHDSSGDPPTKRL